MAIQVRATQQSIAARVMSGLQANISKMGRLQEQLSSGKLITRPSDSPTGTVSALQLRGEMRALEQYSRNADDGIGWLGTIDTTLTSSLDQIRRVRDLTLEGASAGTGGSPQAREAIAKEVENIRESLIGMANTKYLGRPVFGGITAGDTAYDASSGTFSGVNSAPVKRTVGDGTEVRVDLDGPTAFGNDADPTQLFTVLQDIVDNLRASDPAALRTDLGNLDTAIGRVQRSLSDVGARYNRVEQMRQTADDRLISFRSQLSGVEDIDLPQTIMDSKLQETAYQAALAAGAKVIQPSLMDYLR